MSDLMITEKQGNVGIITFNKPKVKNAIDDAFNLALLDALRVMDFDREIKCVILKGSANCFCSGADLGQKAGTMDDSRVNVYHMGAVAQQITTMDTPVIAMVEGSAVGGGFGIAMACDFIVMEENAKISPNFMSLGLVPELGSLATLSMAVGPQMAKKLAFTSARMSAQECLEYGIAAYVYSADEILEKTLAFAAQIAEMPVATLAIAKKGINFVCYDKVPALLMMECQNTPFLTNSPEGKAYKEAYIAKFMNKKK